jgi:hypothetical protein
MFFDKLKIRTPKNYVYRFCESLLHQARKERKDAAVILTYHVLKFLTKNLLKGNYEKDHIEEFVRANFA